MKKPALVALFLASPAAFAHGPAAEQAAHAVTKAAELFVAAQPQPVRREFLSIAATQTGHEQFAVTITLKDGATRFSYACEENEAVEPVRWECQAQ